MNHRKSGLRLIAVLAIALMDCGCGSAARPEGKGPKLEPLRIAAASDLQAALPVLAEQFTARTKVELTLTFGSSGQLAEQIKAGAPFDVFLAANQNFVKELSASGFIRPESVRPYARGSLVLAVHRESGGAIASLSDLTKPEVKKIALANPETAPYGAAGKEALERSDLWSKLGPKLVQAESVRQALQFVQSGNAEAGLVGRAIANLPEVRIVEVDPELYEPIVQGLGVVTRSPRAEVADRFAGFVVGEEGQSILKAAGFSSVAP